MFKFGQYNCITHNSSSLLVSKLLDTPIRLSRDAFRIDARVLDTDTDIVE